MKLACSRVLFVVPAATVLAALAAPAAEAPRVDDSVHGHAPRDHRPAPEVESLAARLGGDPAAILAFVSREIRYEAYLGVLRGSRGALLAGAANAADRALLLRDLLRLADPAASLRFAFATLPEETVRELLERDRRKDRATEGPPEGVSGGPAAGRGGTTRAEEGTPIGDGELEARLSAALGPASAEEALEVVRTVRSEIEASRSDVAWLERILSANGFARQSLERSPEHAVAAVRSHVWLQIGSAAGWVDLDPAVPDPAPGKRLLEPQNTAPEVPEALHHRVRVRVRLETIVGDRIVREPLLSFEVRSADMVGTSLTYLHAESFGLEPILSTRRAGSTGAPEASVEGRHTPILLFRGEIIEGRPFFVRGSSRTPGADAGAVVGARVGGLLRRRPSSAPEAHAPPQAAAVWLEVDTVPPAGESASVERPIFDRIGMARHALPDLSGVELGPPRGPYGDEDPLVTTWTLVAWSGERRLPEAGPAGGAPRGDERIAGAAAIVETSEASGALLRARRAIEQAMLDAACGGRHAFVPDGPNLDILVCAPAAEGAGDVRLAIDLLRSRAETVGGTGAEPIDGAAPAGVLWGVAAHRSERLVLRLARLGEPAAGLAPDVSAVFETARAERIPELLLRPGEEGRLASLDASPEAKARLAIRLKEGLAVVVPARAPAVDGRRAAGWWLIDPRTGRTLDELENGTHLGGEHAPVTGGTRAQTEAAKQGFLSRVWKGVKKAGRTVACVLVVAVPAIQGGADGVITAAEIQSIVDGVEAAVECRKKAPPQIEPPGKLPGGKP